MEDTYHHGFRISSFCATGGCVEVAPLPDGAVAVRDSKNHRIPALRYTAEEWFDFIKGVKAGEFDFDLTTPDSGSTRS